MSWHFVERWLQKVNQHSTLIGKFWITFLIIFRIVVISSVGDRVYSDEQSEFKCNTQQVGCPNVCFNKFSPISHIRFWSFQIILVTAPSIAFVVYTAHKVKKKPPPKRKFSLHAGQSSSPNIKPSSRPISTADEKRKNSKIRQPSTTANQDTVDINQKLGKGLFGDDKSSLSQHYFLYALSVIARTGIEVVFMYLQYTLFGFSIVELYQCQEEPCPNTVDCFVSRPMEKTIFLWFMFIITILCLFLNALELLYLFWKLYVKRRRLMRKQKRQLRYQSVHVLGTGEKIEPQFQTLNSAKQLPSAPPNYRKIISTPDFGAENVQYRSNNDPVTNPIAMNFSINDAMFPTDEIEAFQQPDKYMVSMVSSPSTNNVFPAREEHLNQPHTVTNRTEGTGSKQKTFNNYV